MIFRNADGFSLIETLVVVSILSILAAIAIPAYAGYKASAVDATVTADLRSARSAMESYYIQANSTYSGADLAALEDNGFQATPSVVVRVVSVTDTDYVLRSCGDGSSATSFVYDSDVGETLPDTGTC